MGKGEGAGKKPSFCHCRVVARVNVRRAGQGHSFLFGCGGDGGHLLLLVRTLTLKLFRVTITRWEIFFSLRYSFQKFTKLGT